MLKSLTRNQVLLTDLEVADGFVSRGVGLVGRKGLGDQQGLWLIPGNSIHMFFMRFAIDCVFVDRDLKVKAIFENVRPWRLVLPVWGARSVFELPSGAVRRLGLQVGEELHVGA